MQTKINLLGKFLIVGVVGLMAAGAVRASANADLSLTDPVPFDAAAAGSLNSVVIDNPVNLSADVSAGPSGKIVIAGPVNLSNLGGSTAIPQAPPPTPEPSTLALAGLGAASLLAWRRRKN